MKVNNLLKRIGSVVTTAAMLATLGTTGFAANPYEHSLAEGNIKITNVTRDAKDNGVYEFTINYESEADKMNSIGVTMLTYVMKDRSDLSLGSTVENSKYNVDGSMQIVGVNQEKQTSQGGTIKFAVATSEDSTKLKDAMVMKPGQKGLVMIGGDNTTPAVAEFSIPVAAWTIASATVKPNATLDNKIEYGKDKDAINTAVYNYITGVDVSDSDENHTTTLTKKTGATKFDGITITKKGDANTHYAEGMVGEFEVTIPLNDKNFDIPTESGATIGTVNTVTVGIEVDKDKWTAANATVGKENKISVAKGTTDIAAEIKKVGITIDNGATEGAKKTYKLSSAETSTLDVKYITTEGSAEDTKTYEVSGFAGKYESENKTAEITVKEGLKATVTVKFTENIASAISLVTKGSDDTYTKYNLNEDWNANEVKVKSDVTNADTVAKTLVKAKLDNDKLYAKIDYTNENTSGGPEYVKVADLVDLATVADNKVKVTVSSTNVTIPSDVNSTFEFGYTVTPVYTAEAITVVGTTDYQKATADEDPTVGIKNLRKGLAIKVDGKDIPKEARVEWSDPVIVADGNSYTATITISGITSGELYEKWPTAEKLTKTVTGKITVKPAEVVDAKTIEVAPVTQPVGTSEANVISNLKTNVTKATAKAGEASAQVDIKSDSWAVKSYNPNVIGDNEFTAKVVGGTYNNIKVNDDAEVTVKVTLTAITVDATKIVTVNVPEGYTAETVANALPKKLTYTSGTLTDTVDVTWTTSGIETSKKNDETFTVNGEVDDKSDSEIFIFNPKAVTANVTVRNSVESNKAWELGNTGEYNAGTVKVYLPTTAKQGNEVIATLYKADGTTLAGATATVTLTSDYNADTYNSVDLTFDKSFNAAGINANDKYTVKVTVAGTPLVYKDAENNDADSVQGTVYPTTSRRPSTGGGSTTPEVKSYNVSVKADNNGKATVNKSKATAGETVAVNVEPNEGYKVKEITVKDVNGKSIDVDQKTRTFEMPEGAVTVTVTFEEGTEEPTPDDKGKFKDVPDSFWAAADIYTLREAGIIDGKTADEFDPEGQVTRAEFTKMIVKMFGVEAKDTKVEFADCGEDDWFTPFVAAAVEAGYVKGYSDTEFAPDKVISREEACAILGRAYAKAANSELSFTDKDSIDEYAQPYVALLVEMGFINGYEDGTFRAQNHITRAEAAKIIGCAYRLATASK